MKKLLLAVFISFFFAQVTQGYAPDSIAGKAIVYTEGSESEVTTFSSDGKVYGDKDGEWTFYTYEKLSANVGKVIYTFENEQTPMPEEEILTFTSENAGTFEWSEYSDATMSTTTDNGSGTFSISNSETNNLAVRPLSIRASRDLVYLQTPSGPNEIEGAGEIGFELELLDQPNITNLSLTIDGQTYSLSSDQKPSGFSLEFGYKDQSKPNELFDLESASDSDWTEYANQTNFAFSLTADGSEYSYSHNLPAESELPQPANISVNGDYTWKKDTEGYDYVEILKNDSYQFSWDAFSSADSKDYIVVHLQELVGDDDVQVIPEVILDADKTSYIVDGSYFEAEKKYFFAVELMNITEQQNPNGFTHASGSDTSLPLLQTTARMVTALDLMVNEEKVVVSDPTGMPVVVQLGEDYQWNDTLDGVMLWGVWQDDDTNEWVIATVNYIGGRQKGAKGSYSSLPNELDVDHPYTINGDTIDVTETNGHQYYQVTSVDNDIIYAVDGDGTPLTDPSWWFVTKSAAESFYNSKINYAPESIAGIAFVYTDGSESETATFSSDGKVYGDKDGEWTYYTYEKLSANVGKVIYTFENEQTPMPEEEILTFTSENAGTFEWSEYSDATMSTKTDNGTGTFTFSDNDYAPDYLNGWKLDAGASTYKFTGDSTGVFYHVDEGNYSNSELSNITYTWEKIGPGIGKLYTSLDEITWMYFDDNTTGRYHWQEQEQENESSGDFSLNYYPDGHAQESLVGSSLKFGDTYYVFTSDTSVTVSEGSTSSIMEYAYLKNGSNNGILSIDPENRFVILDLDFSSSEYGTVERGGSGIFRVLQNWETKGWVWYGHYPWAYSHNMQDWYYQVLFTNDENESDMAHYQIWDKQWKVPGELNYLGESNFSTDDAYSWEEYDEFKGSELNTTRWDVAWWDGGTAPSVDQVNNRIEFNKGSSYEAKLSALMNVPNPNAESEYSYGYDASYGFAPSTIADMNVRIHEEQNLPEYSDYGVDDIYYSDGLLFRYDRDEQQQVQEPYSYERTGPNTAKIRMQSSGELYVADLTFTSENSATGTWEEQEDGVTYSGSLTFDIVFSPHSLLEFVQSDDIYGIEFELMIPNDAPDQTCIGLFAVDYNAMFNATSDEQEEQALRFDLDLCYFDGTLTSEFNFKDQTTGEEISESQNSTLGDFQKFRFYFSDGRIYFSLPEQEVKEYNFDRANETFVIRAQNEQNLDFSAYLRNVRVLRKKSYPQGWMWMDYYPWVYCHDLQSWLYYSLVKDSNGNPNLMFWDDANENWDLYYPTFSTAQAEEKEKADQLLNDN